MKIRFKQECVDKHTNEEYKAGEVYQFSEKRAKEILKTGYAEEVVEAESKE